MQDSITLRCKSFIFLYSECFSPIKSYDIKKEIGKFFLLAFLQNTSILSGKLPFVVITIDFTVELEFQISDISKISSLRKGSPPVKEIFLRQGPVVEAIFSILSIVSSFSEVLKSTKQCGQRALQRSVIY